MLGSSSARRNTFGIGSFLVLVIAGSAFSGVAYLMLDQIEVDDSWDRASGKVVDVTRSSGSSNTYSPVVEYVVGGQTYTATSPISSSSRPLIGEAREVAYNKAQPSESKIVEGSGEKGFLYLFFGLGILMIVGAIVSLIQAIRRRQAIRRLIATGHKTTGVLVDVAETGKSNKSTLYTVTVAATDQFGSARNFTSDGVTGVGGLLMSDFHNQPIPVDVYIDTQNPEHYYVDLADLPNLTPARIKDLIQKAAEKSNGAASSGIDTGTAMRD